MQMLHSSPHLVQILFRLPLLETLGPLFYACPLARCQVMIEDQKYQNKNMNDRSGEEKNGHDHL
jgi:hypothetical protein